MQRWNVEQPLVDRCLITRSALNLTTGDLWPSFFSTASAMACASSGLLRASSRISSSRYTAAPRVG